MTADALAAAAARARSAATEMAAHLADGERGEAVRDGVRVAILGPPNAGKLLLGRSAVVVAERLLLWPGKSSLLNALAARDAAIVSPTAGTTRGGVRPPPQNLPPELGPPELAPPPPEEKKRRERKANILHYALIRRIFFGAGVRDALARRTARRHRRHGRAARGVRRRERS